MVPRWLCKGWRGTRGHKITEFWFSIRWWSTQLLSKLIPDEVEENILCSNRNALLQSNFLTKKLLFALSRSFLYVLLFWPNLSSLYISVPLLSTVFTISVTRHSFYCFFGPFLLRFLSFVWVKLFSFHIVQVENHNVHWLHYELWSIYTKCNRQYQIISYQITNRIHNINYKV